MDYGLTPLDFNYISLTRIEIFDDDGKKGLDKHDKLLGNLILES